MTSFGIIPSRRRRRQDLFSYPPVGGSLNAASSLATGLVFWFPLNERGGTPVDLVTGGVATLAFASGGSVIPTWTDPIDGPGMHFVSGFKSCLNANWVAAHLQSGPISAACWVYQEANQAWGGYPWRLGDAPSNNDFCINVAGAVGHVGAARVEYVTGGTFTGTQQTGFPLAAGEWYHLAATYDGKNYRIFVNGQLVGTSGTITRSTTPFSTHFRMGYDADSETTGGWFGNLVNIAGWNRCLDQAEVLELFENPWGMQLGRRQYYLIKGVVSTPVAVLGVSSQEMFGAPSLSQATSLPVSPKGIWTAENQGAVVLSKLILPAGIQSSESEGAANAATLTNAFPGGIASAEAFGKGGVGENLLPIGIPSSEQGGLTNAVTNNASNVFADGIPSQEAVGVPTPVSGGVNPGGIFTQEALGQQTVSYNLLMDGIASQEFLGAPAFVRGNVNTPFTVRIQARERWSKPRFGTKLNRSDPLANGMVFGTLLNSSGVPVIEDLVSGNTLPMTLDGSTKTFPNWVVNDRGGFAPGNANGRWGANFPSTALNTDLWKGPMTVAIRFLADQRIENVSFMGKSDGTDGAGTFTSGWNVNIDQDHQNPNSIHSTRWDYVNYPPPWLGDTGGSLGPGGTDQYWDSNPVMKLEFEANGWNKMGGLYLGADTYTGVQESMTPGGVWQNFWGDKKWHLFVATTKGGANQTNGAYQADDYHIYWDGIEILQSTNPGTGFDTNPGTLPNVWSKYFYPETGTQYTTSDSGRPLTIGNHPGFSYAQATIDMMTLHNRVLGQDEVQRMMVDPYCWARSRKFTVAGVAHATGPSLNILPLGIVSAAAFGALMASVPPTLNINPIGISGEGRFGALNVSYPQSVTPLGIWSEAHLGALQAALANIQNLFPGAITSFESLGGPIAIVGVPVSSGRVFNPQSQIRIFSVNITED